MRVDDNVGRTVQRAKCLMLMLALNEAMEQWAKTGCV